MIENSQQNIFIQGAIPVGFITNIVQQYNLNTNTGAYSIFIGQVRGDEAGGSTVKAIEYTTHTEIALEKFKEIKAALQDNYAISGFHIYHSLGMVKTGGICFFVLVASGHRKGAITACNEAVERIKSELPLWGKLLLENEGIQWKENK